MDMTLKKKYIISVKVLFWLGTLFMIILLATCARFEPEAVLVLRTEFVEELAPGEYSMTGRIINMGREDIEQHGFCWAQSQNPTINDQSADLGFRETAGEFTTIITDLSLDKLYYFRAFATTREGTIYGKDITFTTPPPQIPMVNTAAVGTVKMTTAEISGDVVSDGGGEVTARGICWSTSPEPTISDNRVPAGTGTGSFTVTLTGLTCSSNFFARAYGINSAGPGYGTEVSFTTEQCVPETGRFVFKDNSGVWILTDEGDKAQFLAGSDFDIEVFNNMIFVRSLRNISIYSSMGSLIGEVSIDGRITSLGKMCVLPGQNLAFLNNNSDTVTFANELGVMTRTISITNLPPDDNLQSVNGIVVDNRLIISEDGNNHLVSIDLGTYSWSELKNFEHLSGWLSDVDYSDGTYYLCQSKKLFSFTEDGEEHLICELPDYHNTGIAVLGDFAYITSNFGNKIYRVNLRNGDYEVIANAEYPKDIELID